MNAWKDLIIFIDETATVPAQLVLFRLCTALLRQQQTTIPAVRAIKTTPTLLTMAPKTGMFRPNILLISWSVNETNKTRKRWNHLIDKKMEGECNEASIFSFLFRKLVFCAVVENHDRIE